MSRQAPIYQRSLVRDTARTFAAARSQCWCQPQLTVLDWVVRAWVDEICEHDPTLDVGWLLQLCRYQQGRLTSREIGDDTSL